MKVLNRISLVAMILMLLFASTVIAEEAQEYVIPAVGDTWAEYYHEVDLDNMDRIQDQVKAYEADLDMAELPDFDIYLFEDERSIEEYAQLEADLYGAPLHVLNENGKTIYTYVSAELYDDIWYIARNSMFALPSGKIEELCLYHRTEKYTVGNSDLTVRIPLIYKLSEIKDEQDGIFASLLLPEEESLNFADSPFRIDLIEKEIPDGLGADDVLFDYATRTDSLTEIVTINGRSYYKIVGPVSTAEGSIYSVLYLYPDGEHIVGVSFSYETGTNGTDLAIMETTGF